MLPCEICEGFPSKHLAGLMHFLRHFEPPLPYESRRFAFTFSIMLLINADRILQGPAQHA
jgi:hypothetical protein